MNLFESIIDEGSKLEFGNVLVCMLAALVLGLILAVVYMKTERAYKKDLVVSLVVLPLVTSAILSIVNGSLGSGIAVLGVFALVRFRSRQGTSKEIVMILSAMGAGLAAASGYLFFALVLTVIVSVVLIILSLVGFGSSRADEKRMKISIPENLNYEEIFDDLFTKYLKEYSLDQVRTTNLGSMFELRYTIVMKPDMKEKALIDELRTRNGNLPIVIGKKPDPEDSL